MANDTQQNPESASVNDAVDQASQPAAQPSDPSQNYPASPDQGGPGPLPQGPTPQTAAPAKPQSKWANVVKGALSGLMIDGAPGFVAGAINPSMARNTLKNRQAQNDAKTQQDQAQVKFTDTQSALNAQLSTIDAMKAAHLPDEYKAESEANTQKLVQFNQEHLGIQYDAIPNTPEAIKQYLDSQQGGAQMGRAIASPSQLYIPKSSTGQNDDDPMAKYDKAAGLAKALGVPIAAKTDYLRMKPTDRAKAIAGIVNIANGHAPNGDPLTGDKLANRISDMQSKLDTYASSDGADKAVVGQVKTTIAQMQNDLNAQHGEQTRKGNEAIRVGSAIAQTRAQAMQDSKGVKVAGPNGTTVYAHLGDAIKSGAVDDSTAKSLQPLEKTAEDSEKSYQMFQDAYADFKKGTTTGAQSMLALSQHLATTFGNVKGSRVTKDMIQEHLGARSISDKALAATQKLSNGDVLTPDQWDAFRELIGQSRKYSWALYSTKANAANIDVRGLVPKDLGGTRDIHNAAPTGGTPQANQQKSGKPSLDSFWSK